MCSNIPQIIFNETPLGPSRIPTDQNYYYNITPKTPKIDRFIPNRSLNNLETSYHLLSNKKINSTLKVLNLSNKIKPENEDSSLLHNKNSKSVQRKLPFGPDIILDAPGLNDDFYLNLMDWSNDDKLAVGLGNEVFIKSKSDVSSLIDQDSKSIDQNFYITSVKWLNEANMLAVANSKNSIELWDVEKKVCISKICDHSDIVSSMDCNGPILSSGSFNGNLFNHDFRSLKKINEYNYHSKIVCGLKWNNNGRFLASGSDDCCVCIWDLCSNSQTNPFHVINDHVSSVKAIAWCPWQNSLLATGGGKTDCCIKLWNVYNGVLQNNIKAESQISGLIWSNEYKEILSSHADIENSLIFWKYPYMEKVGVLNGHVERILSICLSPNGEVVVSLGADQTIQFWECFKSNKQNSSLLSPVSIRNLNLLQNIR